MANPVVQLNERAIFFLAGMRVATNGAARMPSLSTLLPTRTAVRVIVFKTLWNDRLQAVFRVRLAI
jgi:hypothetical protein